VDVGSTAKEPLVCVTLRWREMDSNFWYRSRKARDFQNVPEAAGTAGVRYG